MTEREQLTTLCDEISRMIPSHTLRDTSTTQFTEFIELLQKKVKPQEIDAIIKAYNYFNTLMGDIKPDTSNKTNEETKDLQETKSPVGPVTQVGQLEQVAPVASLSVTSDPNDTSESEEIVELLLHLSDVSTSLVV